ncbi:Mobile element protein [Microcystis aeruginosa NIES-98]|nr:Mobile element protein [Microcystis aeruginosa NIES-98]
MIINQDNGSENNSRRTQFMKRIVEFSQKYQVNIPGLPR